MSRARQTRSNATGEGEDLVNVNVNDEPELSVPIASAVTSASSPIEVGPTQRNSSAAAPDVITISPDTSPVPSRPRAVTRGRKARRLNDSSSVIVLDDEDSQPRPRPSPAQAEEIREGPTIRPRVTARRGSARAGSSSSARPAPRLLTPPARMVGARRARASNLMGGNASIPVEAVSMTNVPTLGIRRGNSSTIARGFNPAHPGFARLAIFRVNAGLAGEASTASVGRGSGARRGRGIAGSLLPRRWEFAFITNDLPDYETLIGLDDQLIRERNAAPKSVIEKLPEVVATEEDENLSCVVCMCDIEKGDKLRVLPCSHKYHKICIDKWLTYNACCPVDKTRICDFQRVNKRPPGPSRRAGPHTHTSTSTS